MNQDSIRPEDAHQAGSAPAPDGEGRPRTHGTFRTKSILCEAWRWDPSRFETVGAVIGTLMAHGIPVRHPSGMGATTTLQLGDTGTGPIAQPGDWIVRVDGRWGIVDGDDFFQRYEPAAAQPRREKLDSEEIAKYAGLLRAARHMSCGHDVRDTCPACLESERTLRSELAVAYTELQQAVAHDRQPYPTQWAYEHAVAAVNKHRVRADTAEAVTQRVRELVEPATRNVQAAAARLARRVLAELDGTP